MRRTGRSWPVLLIGAAALGAALVARARLDVVEVRGLSMAPALLPGDRLLVVRSRRTPRAGDVVLAADPREPGRELIKRVARGGRALVLRGDSAGRSTDSRSFGPIPSASVRWRAAARYWPPGRMGPIPRHPR